MVEGGDITPLTEYCIKHIQHERRILWFQNGEPGEQENGVQFLLVATGEGGTQPVPASQLLQKTEHDQSLGVVLTPPIYLQSEKKSQ